MTSWVHIYYYLITLFRVEMVTFYIRKRNYYSVIVCQNRTEQIEKRKIVIPSGVSYCVMVLMDVVGYVKRGGFHLGEF